MYYLSLYKHEQILLYATQCFEEGEMKADCLKRWKKAE